MSPPCAAAVQCRARMEVREKGLRESTLTSGGCPARRRAELCRPWQGRGPCSVSVPASPRLTPVQCPWPRLPRSIIWCWAEGVACRWIWDVLPASIWASLGSQGRELESYCQRGDSESCSRAGHNSEECIGLNKQQERPCLCSCCHPFIIKVLQWTTHLSGNTEGRCPGWNETWQEHKFTAAVCLSFPYSSALPPEWSRWHCQDFHPS